MPKVRSMRRTVAGASLAAATVLVAACGASGATTIAARSGPRSIPSVAHPVPTTAPVAASPSVAHAGSTPSTSSTRQTSSPSTAAGTQASKSGTSASTSVAPKVTTPLVPPRTVPTAAQVKQLISAVHAEFFFFTPTPAQIAHVGNEVCTALDQGDSIAQIKATAVHMAGPFAAMVPAGFVNSAARTIVNMYCPGYDSKLT